MIRLGSALKRATGLSNPKRGVRVITTTSGLENEAEVIHRVDNQFFSGTLEELAVPLSVSSIVMPDNLPGGGTTVVT